MATRLLLLTLLSLINFNTHAGDKPGEIPQIYGWLERGIVLPLEATVKVKLDSGALTSSMHATDITPFKRNDRNWVRFRLELEDKITGEQVQMTLEKKVYRYARIRGAGGEERRPVVVLPFCIGDKILREQFTLNDRKDMLYPVLLGRRTLKELGLIDTSATFLNKPECDLSGFTP